MSFWLRHKSPKQSGPPAAHTGRLTVSAGQHCTRLPQSLTGGRGLSSPAASTRGGEGGLPTAPQLLAAFLVAGAASTGGFPQSTRAGKAAVCAEGRSRDPFSGRALYPEDGGWFRLPSRPGPQGAGICQASLEPASYSNCPPRLGLLYPCVTFLFSSEFTMIIQLISIKIPHLNFSCVYSVIY